MRLQVYLAHAGVASRRASEEIIKDGRVSVNGIIIKEMGAKIEEGDEVLLDGKPVVLEKRKIYLALNKPAGYICTNSDPQGRALALSLLPKEITERLYSVGRLDFLSSGLILFTNDGEFANKLGHPSCEIEKEYFVEATGKIHDEAIEAFNKGITIKDADTGDEIFYKAKLAQRINWKSMRIILVEGKNREIRRIFSHFHMHPAILKRTRIGPVFLGDLAEGSSRELTNKEILSLGGK